MPNADLRTIDGALSVPEGLSTSSMTLWCEYAIWGLLFHDDQSPWLTVVECLQICFSRQRAGLPVLDGLPESGEHEVIRYATPLNHHLRHLLFRDRDILEIAERNLDDHSMWEAWKSLLDRDQIGLNFDYLRKAFQSFQEMANAVELLRSAEIESQTAKRWTSRHLLPLGDNLLFPDVAANDGLDRKFMRRTGELLYLMLNRAGQREELAGLITNRLLATDKRWNKLAARLAGPDRGGDASTSVGYLPMASHTAYDVLAADWIALLKLQSVPIENVLDPLQRLSGLAQALYILQQARATIGSPAPPLAPFLMDLVGVGRSPVRKLSIALYQRHQAMLGDAMAQFVERFGQTEAWSVIADEDDRSGAAHALKTRFLWDAGSTNDPDRLLTPVQQIDQLRMEAQSPRGHSVVSAFRSHLKHLGLLRSYRRSGTWYAPTDNLLEALVLGNVTTPMEFNEFLQRIHNRYNIVAGPEQVRAAFGTASGTLPVPLADLQDNERRLEERLRVLGFLDRKSDDCAFVINPFYSLERSSAGVTGLDPA